MQNEEPVSTKEALVESPDNTLQNLSDMDPSGRFSNPRIQHLLRHLPPEVAKAIINNTPSTPESLNVTSQEKPENKGE